MVPQREIYALWAECRSERDSTGAMDRGCAAGDSAAQARRSVAVRDEPGFGQIEFRFLRGLHLHGGQLDQHIGLNIHGRADGERVQIGAPVGERQNGDGDLFAIDSRRW